MLWVVNSDPDRIWGMGPKTEVIRWKISYHVHRMVYSHDTKYVAELLQFLRPLILFRIWPGGQPSTIASNSTRFNVSINLSNLHAIKRNPQLDFNTILWKIKSFILSLFTGKILLKFYNSFYENSNLPGHRGLQYEKSLFDLCFDLRASQIF